MFTPRALVASSSAIALLVIAGCSSNSGGEGAATKRKTTVVTSLYPLEYAAQQVGGEHVSVRNLTPPGAEPHSLELTPRQVLETADLDAFIYLSNFAPAVDDAAKEAGEAAFDVREHARLDLDSSEEEEHAGESPKEHAEHADEEEQAPEGLWRGRP